MSLVNPQPRKPEGMWLPAGLRMLLLQAEETGSGVTDVMWRLQRDVVVRTKAVRDPKEPCSPKTALPLQEHWPPGVPRVPQGQCRVSRCSGGCLLLPSLLVSDECHPSPGSADLSLHSSPRALGSPVQKEVVKNGRPAGRSGEGQRPSGWLIGARPRLGGRLRPRQCAPELGAGKAWRDCYRIS